MNQLHHTLDFESVLNDNIAPDAVQALRQRFEFDTHGVSDRGIVRMCAASLTFHYLTPLLTSSLKMSNQSKLGDLPPDLRAVLQELEEVDSNKSISSMTPDLVQEFVGRAKRIRATMVKYIRPDIFTSKDYKDFVDGYAGDSRIEPLSSLELYRAPQQNRSREEPAYIVHREAFEFAMVERGGVMKIASITPLWLD
jgi:hypothetical protein